ncbi:hypothetical protein GCM10025868_25700 [Angustibacter aerolatus]|uniref:Uncharacterized protein n=1 Tax=Angustibacter aerolatus TaxID=1162965 RepID=A0ABQ6JJA3_9ACTN|nr:hypothetical protein GCM10025868_25700 [Angustibacter aerolatus]
MGRQPGGADDGGRRRGTDPHAGGGRVDVAGAAVLGRHRGGPDRQAGAAVDDDRVVLAVVRQRRTGGHGHDHGEGRDEDGQGAAHGQGFVGPPCPLDAGSRYLRRTDDECPGERVKALRQ